MNQNSENSDLGMQRKLLPWFVIMPTLLIGVFIYLASQQLSKFNASMEIRQDTTLLGQYIPVPNGEFSFDEVEDKQKYLRWITLTRMEQESYYRRYHQAGQILMSRIYTKYLGFFTGMILAIVGSVFIIGKIKEETSKIGGTLEQTIKFNIVSSSPGVIFAVLGTVLMIATIVTHNKLEVEDAPLYLNHRTITALDLGDLGLTDPGTAKTDSTETTKVDSAMLKKHLQLWQ